MLHSLGLSRSITALRVAMTRSGSNATWAWVNRKAINPAAA